MSEMDRRLMSRLINGLLVIVGFFAVGFYNKVTHDLDANTKQLAVNTAILLDLKEEFSDFTEDYDDLHPRKTVNKNWPIEWPYENSEQPLFAILTKEIKPNEER